MATVADVIRELERFAPPALAASWDNVGLLLGDQTQNCSRVLTCLTLTPDVAAEAIQSRCQLIVTHHPILFRGAKRITADNAEGRAILALAHAGIAVYSPHTAFDNCAGGINDLLSERIGLAAIGPLRAVAHEEYKLVAFVPEPDLGRVSDAIFAAGAGVIGEYRQCSFRIAGTGTFFGTDATNPAVGQKGQREEVSEWRLEAVCPKSRLETVIAALRSAHSYEVPAFDVYPMVPVTSRGGEGRVGRLTQEMSVNDLANRIKRALNASQIQVVGDGGTKIGRVAVACGAAGEFLPDAIRADCDAFVTGEIRFHDYLAAQAAGIALIMPGHYATERFAVEELAKMFDQRIAGVTFAASDAERDPVQYL